jgi:hypothetical protein
MIPTMLVYGLLVGRWWRFAVVSSAVIWPVILLSDGVTTSPWVLLAAAGFGAANAAVGAVVHQAILRGVRAVVRGVRDAGGPELPHAG